MAKRLIVCCDGTWNTPDQTSPTNVDQFYRAIAPAGPDDTLQLATYVPGVGTKPWDRLVGGMFGVGLSSNVKRGYRFLVDHYEAGDDLFLLGFSRGAYTARSLAGLIRNAGILRTGEADRIDQAYQLYRDENPVDSPDAVAFRRDHAVSESTPIRFIGVWDTVGELGIPDLGFPGAAALNRRWQFHDVQLSSSVQSAYQALAIDEHRGPFKPTLWQTDHDADQHVEQVWFPGVHCDVGGGYEEHEPSDITLCWMQQKAADCGLGFEPMPTPCPVDYELADLHRSFGSFYKLLKPSPRALGNNDPEHESVATTAISRHEQETYSPAGLMAYLDRPDHHETPIDLAAA